VDPAFGEGLTELAALDEPGCVGDGDATGLGIPFVVDPIAELTLPAFDPAAEFVLPALFDPLDEFAFPDLLDEFVSPGLFDPALEFVLADFDLLFELPGELELSRADEFLLLVWFPRLFAFVSKALLSREGWMRVLALGLADRMPPVVSDHWKLRGRLVALGVLLPGTAITTSSRLPFCCTWAVEPGCNRKARVVLVPLLCAVTSAKPRPRTASARGTSDAGIFT